MNNYWLSLGVLMPTGIALISVWAVPWWNNFVYRKQDPFHRRNEVDREQSKYDLNTSINFIGYQDSDDLSSGELD